MADNPTFITNVIGGTGSGTISKVYTLLFESIGVPEKFVMIPLNRQNRILKQVEYAACSLYRFKSEERAQKYAFSEMIYFFQHYKLYQQSTLEPLGKDILNESGDIRSLPILFNARPNGKLLTVPKHYYGSVLDQQLSQLPKDVKIDLIGSNPPDSLSRMFFSKRGDYALLFPSEVAAYLTQYPNNSYRRYALANVESATKGYMMCNKHPDSYTFINKVNQALPSLYKDPSYQKAHLDYYESSEHETIIKFIAALQP